MKNAFQQLFHQLEANNSQKRFMALLVCNELMQRSKLFRMLLSEKMQLFISLTIVGGERQKGQRVETRLQVAAATTRTGGAAAVAAASSPPAPLGEARYVLLR